MKNKKVKFELEAPQAVSVAVAGTFNDWNPIQTLMQRGPDGVWRAKVKLPAGCYEYRFVVDGDWISDPKAKESAPNPHGSENSVVVV